MTYEQIYSWKMTRLVRDFTLVVCNVCMMIISKISGSYKSKKTKTKLHNIKIKLNWSTNKASY